MLSNVGLNPEEHRREIRLVTEDRPAAALDHPDCGRLQHWSIKAAGLQVPCVPVCSSVVLVAAFPQLLLPFAPKGVILLSKELCIIQVLAQLTVRELQKEQTVELSWMNMAENE